MKARADVVRSPELHAESGSGGGRQRDAAGMIEAGDGPVPAGFGRVVAELSEAAEGG